MKHISHGRSSCSKMVRRWVKMGMKLRYSICHAPLRVRERRVQAALVTSSMISSQ